MKKTLYLLLSVVLVQSLLSCSGDYDIIDPEFKIESKLGWHCTKEKVMGTLSEYTPESEEEDFLKYNIDDCISSYQFKDNKLVTSLQLIPIEKAEAYKNEIEKNYKYLAVQSNNSIYYSEKTNTLVALYERTLNDVTYLQIGKTPIESDMFSSIEDIVVTTGDVTTLSKTYAYITANVTGVNSDFETFFCYVEYSLSADLSNSKNVSGNSGVLKVKVPDLISGKTYYYRNYISVGGMYYYGEVKSFTTK